MFQKQVILFFKLDEGHVVVQQSMPNSSTQMAKGGKKNLNLQFCLGMNFAFTIWKLPVIDKKHSLKNYSKEGQTECEINYVISALHKKDKHFSY